MVTLIPEIAGKPQIKLVVKMACLKWNELKFPAEICILLENFFGQIPGWLPYWQHIIHYRGSFYLVLHQRSLYWEVCVNSKRLNFFLCEFVGFCLCLWNLFQSLCTIFPTNCAWLRLSEKKCHLVLDWQFILQLFQGKFFFQALKKLMKKLFDYLILW